jgi:uncharacterized membrane protein
LEPLEISLFLLCCALIVGYHLRLRALLLTRPSSTAYGRHRIVRRRWMRRYAGGENALLTVHTLRNWIMSSTFLASTAILLALGLLSFGFTGPRLPGIVHELNIFGSQSTNVLLFKLLLLALDFICAFLALSLAIRSFIHAGFELNLPARTKGRPFELWSDELEKGALFYFIGLRGFYISIPLALWLLGPLWMLAASLLLIGMLLLLD